MSNAFFLFFEKRQISPKNFFIRRNRQESFCRSSRKTPPCGRNFFMRMDKFLKVSRILKRRTVAGDACKAGKVSVNGKDVKPAYSLKIGDVVELKFAAGSLKFRVLDLKETVKKEEAASLYEILSE